MLASTMMTKVMMDGMDGDLFFPTSKMSEGNDPPTEHTFVGELLGPTKNVTCGAQNAVLSQSSMIDNFISTVLAKSQSQPEPTHRADSANRHVP